MNHEKTIAIVMLCCHNHSTESLIKHSMIHSQLAVKWHTKIPKK